jgi:hypothetical protein
MNKTATNKQTDAAYIEANLQFRRNGMGWWEASFCCGDGYSYSVSEGGTGRSVKTNLRNRLLALVLDQDEHPIQKIVQKSPQKPC